MSNKKLILASSSSLYGSSFLDYLLEELDRFFDDVDELLFVPFARPSGISYDAYTELAAGAFAKIGKSVNGIHTLADAVSGLEQAQGIFTGGGNTFVLVRELYARGLMDVLRRIVEAGTPYLGTSAGANIAGVSMQTTNDMPIVSVPDYATCAWVPFNINPHYLDPIKDSTHRGESRETRIREFHLFNEVPVLGLREGTWLEVQGEKLRIKGELNARLFRQNSEPIELSPGLMQLEELL